MVHEIPSFTEGGKIVLILIFHNTANKPYIFATMPLNLPDRLPAIELLKEENIFVIDHSRASRQDIRPLKIVILNLMPVKVKTETDLIRLLSNSPLQVELSFMKIKSHTSKNTSMEHMKAFYTDFDDIFMEKYDGMIITGAPVEQLEFEEVSYWKDITKIFDWARTHVTSTLYICWAAQAGLYHNYGIPKYPLSKKMFGVFEHYALNPLHPIFRGFDDVFYIPHSRHTEIRKEDILKIPELTLLSESQESGVYMVMARDGRDFFVTGHSEYSPLTLDMEYHRDMHKGLSIEIPKNYYLDNDPNKKPLVRWRGHANLFFSNWLNYHVYQETPYNIQDIE
jgi:homoserine O-succinyltransferase